MSTRRPSRTRARVCGREVRMRLHAIARVVDRSTHSLSVRTERLRAPWAGGEGNRARDLRVCRSTPQGRPVYQRCATSPDPPLDAE